MSLGLLMEKKFQVLMSSCKIIVCICLVVVGARVDEMKIDIVYIV